MKHDERQYTWEPAPVCFSCGRELGSDPADVVYVGYGHRAEGTGPAWVASLCSCVAQGVATGEPSPCVEEAQEFACADGAPLSPEEYRRWLTGA
ncbi:MAG: hypothetical protein ABI333_16695 [bacterium]